MHLYKPFGILLKENNKLINTTVLFLRKKNKSVCSFSRGASKVIFNDSPFNFGRYTSTQCRIEQVIELFHSYHFITFHSFDPPVGSKKQRGSKFQDLGQASAHLLCSWGQPPSNFFRGKLFDSGN